MDPSEVTGIVTRIPIFQGLSPEQIDGVLEACHIVPIAEGETVFTQGAESNSMLILLLGQLEVRSGSGSVLATIGENGVVGEMGVLTDEPRSATVVAVDSCTVLAIPRDELFDLIRNDKDIGFQIYRNVTKILIERLRDNNILLEQQYLMMEDLASGGDLET